ncbi:MAG TPA: sulfatase-like hydrolase/transferase [Usitatibacter sp.]|nr:sulfatase-like hydrolase/transferase [Usitatibacter sp.]
MLRIAERFAASRARAPLRLGAALARLRWPEPWALATLAIFIAMSTYRAHLVDKVYGEYTGCNGCLDASVLASDALVAGLFLAALAICRCLRWRALRLAGAMLGTLAVAAYFADIVIFRLLSHRLLLVDVIHFSGDASRMSTVLLAWLRHSEGLAVAAAGLGGSIAAFAALAGPAAPSRGARWALCALALLAAGMVTPRAEYIHELAYYNLLQVNAEVDPSRPYSERFWQQHASPPPQPLECEEGLHAHPSIVLVVVESLSAYHSKLFSGLNDYTPRLDALARTGSYVRAFHANGFSTEGGLIALLTGRVPIPTAGRFGSQMAFTQVEHDFHRWLAQRGYATEFFTTGDLDLVDRRKWLDAIGIQHAEGADHPYYRGLPRGAFGAAGDAALVDRFLQWYGRERGAGPFMATLLTVGSHPPFVSPGHGIVGEAAAIREADRQVARLADALRERGFFRDGVMVVVGDHRAMTPIPKHERLVLGPAAEVRVMEMAIGATGLPPGEVHGNFQQIDLIPSLRHLVANRTCRDEWQGRFLGPAPDAPVYVVHSDPLRRNELTVIDESREYRLRLDGDDTRFVDTPPPAARALVARVNYERMSRMAEFSAPRPPR